MTFRLFSGQLLAANNCMFSVQPFIKSNIIVILCMKPVFGNPVKLDTRELGHDIIHFAIIKWYILATKYTEPFVTLKIERLKDTK